ncbi:MAG: tRNA (guanosine(37)-N1)-methyltransferase TrmD, partial [Gammaproteobacteria bacterium]
MWFGAVTLFPDMFAPVVQEGVSGRAFRDGRLSFRAWNPRDFTHDVHRTVDDRPYGGGPGMLMKPEPLSAAIDAARAEAPEGAPVVYLSPQGRPVNQALLEEVVSWPGLILVCGRYEGIDERVVETRIDAEWSLGDFVLSGGEIAAMAVIDGIARLVPGVLGHERSAVEDSFTDGLLDCPHYTRPLEFEGRSVPDVLRSGDHAAIARWRREQALRRTLERRPDLLG